MKVNILKPLLLAVVFSFVLLSASYSVITVHAEETDTTVSEENESDSVVETVKKSKTIKVNSKKKAHKILEISKSNRTNYTYSSTDKSVAAVTKKGVIKAFKKGKATITVTEKDSGDVYGTITVKVKSSYDANSLRLLSSIIYCEARGESYAGKVAVGIVVLNRVNSSKFPGTISGVIYQSGQFTPAYNGSLSSALYRYDSGNMNSSCLKAAKAVLDGTTTVNYNGTTLNLKKCLYFSRYVNNAKCTIGNHMFK